MAFSLATWAHSIGNFGNSPDDVRRHVNRLADAGFDLVIPCVKNPPGAVDFFTDVADVNPDYPAWDPLGVLIEAGRSRGLKVHPWFCVFPEGERSRLLREHPEYRGVDNEDKLSWACAMRPQVQEYLLDLYRSVGERYQPHGLHLDYIRTGGFCKCDYCRGEMGQRGVDIDKAPWATEPFQQWVAWRVAGITSFVRRLHEYTRAWGLELSAAVFPGYDYCLPVQAQDWPAWARGRLVEYLFPMTYTPSVEEAVKLGRDHAQRVAGAVPLWEGLMRGESAQTLIDQARAMKELGVEGVVIFHYPAMTDEDLASLEALKRTNP
jgi:uncharacterized lipoprotein YddW (UPF0748 family)